MSGKLTGIFVAFLFAGVFGGAGIWMYVSTNTILNNGVQTEGLVIENRKSYDSDGDATWTPVVEFTLESGEQYTASPNMSTSPPSYAVGDPIKIAYLPDTPHDIIINTRFWTFWFPLIFMIIGGIPAIIMLFLIFSLFRGTKTYREVEEEVNIRSRSRDNEDDNNGGFITRY